MVGCCDPFKVATTLPPGLLPQQLTTLGIPMPNYPKAKATNKKAKRKAINRFRRNVAKEGIISKQSAEALFKSRVLGMPAAGYEKDDGFYETRAWKTLRYEVLRDSNGVCECCGQGRDAGVILHVDHIKPRYKFPALSLVKSNLQVLCSDCNIGKGAWGDTDFNKQKTVYKKNPSMC